MSRRPAAPAGPEPSGKPPPDARLPALVIAVTMALWLFANWAGPRMGWDNSIAILIDLLALAAFIWALAATWRIWRRQSPK